MRWMRGLLILIIVSGMILGWGWWEWRGRGYKVLQGNPLTGRNVVYEADEAERKDGGGYAFSGAGVKTTRYERLRVIFELVGKVEGWEMIKESEDRYLLLSDPMSGEMLPKVRVMKGVWVTRSGGEEVVVETRLAKEIFLADLRSCPPSPAVPQY